MQPKPITIMAFSGVGKTRLAAMLARDDGWTHYSADYIIATEYLGAELDGPVTREDLSALSRYLGQVGKGGLPLDEFKRRQKKYIEAEAAVMWNVGAAFRKAGGNFVNDSTGSFCEIGDEDLYAQLAKETLIVYIKAGPEEEEELLARAKKYPKPLYFPPAKFDGWLKEYLGEHNLASVDDITPDDFSRWVFPKLFHSRLPKYQRIADMYGIAIPAADLKGVESAGEFIKLVHDR